MIDIDEKIKQLSETYENNLYKALKKIADEGIKFSTANHYDDVDTFLYVNSLLEKAYNRLSSVFGNSSAEDGLWLIIHFPNVEIRISDYLELLIVKARNELQKKISEIFNSTSYSELSEKYREINEYLSDRCIENYDYLLDDLEIGTEYTSKNEAPIIKLKPNDENR